MDPSLFNGRHITCYTLIYIYKLMLTLRDHDTLKYWTLFRLLAAMAGIVLVVIVVLVLTIAVTVRVALSQSISPLAN